MRWQRWPTQSVTLTFANHRRANSSELLPCYRRFAGLGMVVRPLLSNVVGFEIYGYHTQRWISLAAYLKCPLMIDRPHVSTPCQRGSDRLRPKQHQASPNPLHPRAWPCKCRAWCGLSLPVRASMPRLPFINRPKTQRLAVSPIYPCPVMIGSFPTTADLSL